MRVASPGLIACLIFALLPLAGSHAQAPTQPQTPLVVNPPVIAPVVPAVPDAVEPQPDPLKVPFAIRVSIRDVVITTPVVTVPVGQLVELTLEGEGSDKTDPAFWTYSENIPDRRERDGGHWVGMSFPTDVIGRAYLVQVSMNGEPGQVPRVAMRWFVVGGLGPQPPPMEPDRPDEPGPTPVTPADPSDHLNILTSKLAASPDGAAKMRDFYTRLASEVRNDTAGGLKTLGELQAWKTREEKAAFAGHPVTKIVGVSAALNGFLDAELGTLDVFLDHDKAAAAFDRIAAACGRAVK